MKLPKLSIEDWLALERRYVVALQRSFIDLSKECSHPNNIPKLSIEDWLVLGPRYVVALQRSFIRSKQRGLKPNNVPNLCNDC